MSRDLEISEHVFKGILEQGRRCNVCFEHKLQLLTCDNTKCKTGYCIACYKEGLQNLLRPEEAYTQNGHFNGHASSLIIFNLGLFPEATIWMPTFKQMSFPQKVLWMRGLHDLDDRWKLNCLCTRPITQVFFVQGQTHLLKTASLIRGLSTDLAISNKTKDTFILENRKLQWRIPFSSLHEVVSHMGGLVHCPFLDCKVTMKLNITSAKGITASVAATLHHHFFNQCTHTYTDSGLRSFVDLNQRCLSLVHSLTELQHIFDLLSNHTLVTELLKVCDDVKLQSFLGMNPQKENSIRIASKLIQHNHRLHELNRDAQAFIGNLFYSFIYSLNHNYW